MYDLNEKCWRNDASVHRLSNDLAILGITNAIMILC